jgi:hypothetical protein
MGQKPLADITPKIRKSFIRAVKKNGGAEYLDQLMTDALNKDFIATLNALSKFTVREKNVNHNMTLEVKASDSVDGWIQGFQSGVKALETRQTVLEHQEAVVLEGSLVPETSSEPAGATIATPPTLPPTLVVLEAVGGLDESLDDDGPYVDPLGKPDYPPLR